MSLTYSILYIIFCWRLPPPPFSLTLSFALFLSPPFSGLCCSEFRSSGWPNPGSTSCEGYVGRNPSISAYQHSLSQYHMWRWQGQTSCFQGYRWWFKVQFLRYFSGERLIKSRNLYICTMYNISKAISSHFGSNTYFTCVTGWTCHKMIILLWFSALWFINSCCINIEHLHGYLKNSHQSYDY